MQVRRGFGARTCEHTTRHAGSHTRSHARAHGVHPAARNVSDRGAGAHGYKTSRWLGARGRRPVGQLESCNAATLPSDARTPVCCRGSPGWPGTPAVSCPSCWACRQPPAVPSKTHTQEQTTPHPKPEVEGQVVVVFGRARRGAVGATNKAQNSARASHSHSAASPAIQQ